MEKNSSSLLFCNPATINNIGTYVLWSVVYKQNYFLIQATTLSRIYPTTEPVNMKNGQIAIILNLKYTHV